MVVSLLSILQLLSVSILWHVNIDCMHTYHPQLISPYFFFVKGIADGRSSLKGQFKFMNSNTARSCLFLDCFSWTAFLDSSLKWKREDPSFSNGQL